MSFANNVRKDCANKRSLLQSVIVEYFVEKYKVQISCLHLIILRILIRIKK